MEIVLIRHGEPGWERDRLAVTNPPLTERGHRQARRLAEALRDEHFDEIFVSPLVRARETARPLLELLGRDEVIAPWLEEIREYTEEQVAAVLHTIGNLTLTKYNGEMSNHPYREKRQQLIDSHFMGTVYSEMQRGLNCYW